jgi:hypothetical protein
MASKRNDAQQMAVSLAAMVATLLIGAQGDATRALNLLADLDHDEIHDMAAEALRVAVDELGRNSTDAT